jgi:hypothetical protein
VGDGAGARPERKIHSEGRAQACLAKMLPFVMLWVGAVLVWEKNGDDRAMRARRGLSTSSALLYENFPRVLLSMHDIIRGFWIRFGVAMGVHSGTL